MAANSVEAEDASVAFVTSKHGGNFSLMLPGRPGSGKDTAIWVLLKHMLSATTHTVGICFRQIQPKSMERDLLIVFRQLASPEILRLGHCPVWKYGESRPLISIIEACVVFTNECIDTRAFRECAVSVRNVVRVLSIQVRIDNWHAMLVIGVNIGINLCPSRTGKVVPSFVKSL
jgi:hypothetical protein